jgi:hypothetical protein
LLLLTSAATLTVLGWALNPNHYVTRMIGYALGLAAASIASVAAIYASFAISVDAGLSARGWLKASAGLFAFCSAMCGVNVIRYVRK